jgi:hypothetical protein
MYTKCCTEQMYTLLYWHRGNVYSCVLYTHAAEQLCVLNNLISGRAG